MSEFNYFNYFTEIEEYFWRKRGAHLLVSPLDWAIVETWQKANLPVEAVMRGIDRAFESYGRSRRSGGRPLKSLAYCVHAVLDAAEEAREAAAGTGPQTERQPRAADPFSRDEVAKFVAQAAAKLRSAAEARSSSAPVLARQLMEIADAAGAIEADGRNAEKRDWEDLERRLTTLEEKLTATLSSSADSEMMLKIRREMDASIAPYRRKMSAPQLAMIEKQYLQKRLFELYGLQRLSLYYLK